MEKEALCPFWLTCVYRGDSRPARIPMPSALEVTGAARTATPTTTIQLFITSSFLRSTSVGQPGGIDRYESGNEQDCCRLLGAILRRRSDYGVLRRRVSQRAADDLTGRGQGQGVPKLDNSRVFVGSESAANEHLKLGLESLARRKPALENHAGLYHLGSNRIGLPYDRGEGHRRVLQKTILNLSGADAVPGRCNQVIVPTDEPQVTVGIDMSLVAAHHPVAHEFRRSGIGSIPVTEKHHRVRTSHRDDAHSVRRQDLTIGVDHLHPVAWNRSAHRAWPRRKKHRAVAHHQVALRLSVKFVDRQIECRAAPFE